MLPNSNLSEEDRWQSDVLDQVFTGLATSPTLSRMLIYKGARVLRLRLHEELRASFDIDASLSDFAVNEKMANDVESREELRTIVHRTTVSFFESQDPVRYALVSSSLENRRRKGPHPRGWDVYWLYLHVRDLADPAAIASLPKSLRIDIAAPEKFSSRSIGPLELDGRTINALTLERMAGEKLRAFLSHLPTYRRKIEETTQVERRVKDLYDLVRITRKMPLTDREFWIHAAEEFRLACESRLVDCQGLASFREDWDGTIQAYAAEKTLPKDVSIEQASFTLHQVVSFLAEIGVVPFSFEMPALDES